LATMYTALGSSVSCWSSRRAEVNDN